MAGYFETSGPMGATDTANSAADDYKRLSGMDPADFKKPALFDHLFGKKKKTKEHGAGSAMALPDTPSPQGTPSPNVATTEAPAISSGKSLLSRILDATDVKNPKYNADGQALVPGTPYTTQQFMQAIQQALGPNGSQPFGMPGGSPPGSPGGNPNTPPGGGLMQPGAMNPLQMGPPPGPGPIDPSAMQALAASRGPVPSPQNPFRGRAAFAAHPPMPPIQSAPEFDPPGGGYFSGGAIRMMRGGYPEHLLYGMPTRYSHGGPDYVQPDGRGDGRSDHVDAKLSPGEFVMDAESVALLGNGDNSAGARKLEEMRQNLRKQKGQALARGHFSPDAKQPGSYLKKS